MSSSTLASRGKRKNVRAIFLLKPLLKVEHRKPRGRYKDNIKIDLMVIRCDYDGDNV
jgi:hypothetical protein